MRTPKVQARNQSIFFGGLTLASLYFFHHGGHNWQHVAAILGYGLMFCHRLACLVSISYFGASEAPD